MWKPVNAFWLSKRANIGAMKRRIPECLLSATSPECVLRLLSLSEAVATLDGSWSDHLKEIYNNAE